MNSEVQKLLMEFEDGSKRKLSSAEKFAIDNELIRASQYLKRIKKLAVIAEKQKKV